MRGIDFEWQADGDSGQWEIVAQTKKRPRRKWPRWLWIVLALVVLVSSAVGYVIVRHRYEEANRQIAFQVQSLIDLEAQAWAEADRDLFMAQGQQVTANLLSCAVAGNGEKPDIGQPVKFSRQVETSAFVMDGHGFAQPGYF